MPTEKPLTPSQVEKLVEIVIDFHWMARRYSDGRMSYVTGLFNDHTRALELMGISLNETADGTVFAQDGMGRVYDGLDDSHARLAKIAETDTRLAEFFSHYAERNYFLLPDYLKKAYDEWKSVRDPAPLVAKGEELIGYMFGLPTGPAPIYLTKEVKELRDEH